MAKIVRIDWLDAHGGNRGGWKDVKDAAQTETLPALSVGVVLRETKRTIVVCPHFVSGAADKPVDTSTSQADGEIAIPKKWIKALTVLGEL